MKRKRALAPCVLALLVLLSGSAIAALPGLTPHQVARIRTVEAWRLPAEGTATGGSLPAAAIPETRFPAEVPLLLRGARGYACGVSEPDPYFPRSEAAS